LDSAHEYPYFIYFFFAGAETMLAYGSLGPGPEFIPYFLGILAWGIMAFSAVLLWPITALKRRFRKANNVQEEVARSEPLTNDLQQSTTD